MATRNTINSNFYQIVNVDANGTPTTIKSQYVANIPAANPAGSNTQVQYNDNGSFGASGNLTFNSTTNTLTATNFSGSGTGLTNITAANITGTVAQANNSNTSNVAVTVSANYQPNITSLGVLTSVTVTGETNLGDVSNITITGGTANYVLSTDGTGNLNWVAQNGGGANANYANFAGTAFSVSGSNVSGEVANANYSSYANIAASANSVAVANVSGIGNIATVNLDGNSSNILYGNGVFATTPIISNVANANYANFAGEAFNVNASNITGTVANANYSAYAGEANTANLATFATTANAVAGANVSGTVANATFALGAGNSNLANTANSVAVANVSGIGNIATVNLDGNASNILFGNGSFSAIPAVSNVANANYANFAGQAYSVLNANVASIAGNVIDLQFKVDNVLDANGHYYIDSDGYYLVFNSLLQDYGQNGGSNISGFGFDGEITSGSNVITSVTLYDANFYDIYDLDSMSSFLVGQYIYINLNGIVNDSIFPVLTEITSVDTANATITVNNNALSSQSFNWSGITGISLSDSVHTNYRVLSRQFLTTVLSTSSTGNIITCYNANPIADLFVDTPIVFSGNIGGITPNQTYWVLTADGGTNEITISNTQGGAEVALTTDTGVMNINSQLLDDTVIASSTQFYFAGPYSSDGLAYSGYTVDPDPNFSTDPTLTYEFTTSSTDFNSDVDQPTHYTRSVNGLVIGTDITDSLTGTLSEPFINGGLTVGHSGLSTQLDPSGAFPRADMRIINYTNNGSDSASILSPGNPPTIGWATYTGNINTPLNQQYLRNGRVIGRLTWTGRAENGQNGGSRPPASIQVQALADWTGNSEPMGMFMQYTPSSIANAINNGGQPRTWLSAANNTTRMNGATNIQFGPTKNNGNSNQIRALSGVSDQTWVEVSGYVTGNAISNGAGGLLNITTTSGSQDGEVALRLSRTVGNTANMEFVLPVADANTMILKDNASGNTLATFTDGNANFSGQLNSLRTFGSFTSNATQTNSNVGNAIYMTLNNDEGSNGVSIVSSSEITVARTGRYNIQFSAQLEKTDSGTDQVEIWLTKNGNVVANSAGQLQLAGNGAKAVAAWNWVDNVTSANTYYQIAWGSTDANVQLTAIDSANTLSGVAVPSLIVTVVPVGA